MNAFMLKYEANKLRTLIIALDVLHFHRSLEADTSGWREPSVTKSCYVLVSQRNVLQQDSFVWHMNLNDG
jgi:hypothetical protein